MTHTERRHRRLAASALLLSSALFAVVAAWAAEGRQLALGKQTALTYKLTHKMHVVEGTSRSAEGRALLLPDGSAQVMIRVEAASFDSGNANRDAHAKEVLEVGRFPYVVFKGRIANAALPTSAPVTDVVQGELEFHGVKQPLTVPVELSQAAPGKLRASLKFPVSLDAHKVERPSMLFMKVEDAVQIAGTVELDEVR